MIRWFMANLCTMAHTDEPRAMRRGGGYICSNFINWQTAWWRAYPETCTGRQPASGVCGWRLRTRQRSGSPQGPFRPLRSATAFDGKANAMRCAASSHLAKVPGHTYNKGAHTVSVPYQISPRHIGVELRCTCFVVVHYHERRIVPQCFSSSQ